MVVVEQAHAVAGVPRAQRARALGSLEHGLRRRRARAVGDEQQVVRVVAARVLQRPDVGRVDRRERNGGGDARVVRGREHHTRRAESVAEERDPGLAAGAQPAHRAERVLDALTLERRDAHVVGERRVARVVQHAQMHWHLRRETAGAYLRAAGIAVRPPGGWGRNSPKPAIEVSTDSEAEKPPQQSGLNPSASACETRRLRTSG